MTDNDTDTTAALQHGRLPTDNWRSTRTGTVIGTLLTVGLVATLIITSGLLRGGAATAFGSALLAGILFLSNTTRSAGPAQGLAGVLLLPAGGLLAFGVLFPLLPPVNPPQAVFLLGIGIAMGGAAALPTGLVAVGRLWSVVVLGIKTLLLPVVAVPILMVVHALSVIGTANPSATTSPRTATPLVEIIGQLTEVIAIVVPFLLDLLLADGPLWSGPPAFWVFFALLTATCMAMQAALRRLPIVELVNAERRDVTAARVVRIRGILLKTTAISSLLALGLGLGWIALLQPGFQSSILDRIPKLLIDLSLAIAIATPLRLLFSGLLVLSLGVILFTVLLKRFHKTEFQSMKWLSPALSGLGFVLVAIQFGPVLIELMQSQLSPQTLILQNLIAALGPMALVLALEVVLATIPVLVCLTLLPFGLLFFPDRAAGAVVVGAGLFISVIGATRLDAPPLVIFATVAGSLVVWDVSQHAAEIGTEIGRLSPTRHVELVHAGGAVIVGLAAIGLVVGSLFAAGLVPVATPTTAPVALLSALVGVILFFAALRAA